MVLIPDLWRSFLSSLAVHSDCYVCRQAAKLGAAYEAVTFIPCSVRGKIKWSWSHLLSTSLSSCLTHQVAKVSDPAGSVRALSLPSAHHVIQRRFCSCCMDLKVVISKYGWRESDVKKNICFMWRRSERSWLWRREHCFSSSRTKKDDPLVCCWEATGRVTEPCPWKRLGAVHVTEHAACLIELVCQISSN